MLFPTNKYLEILFKYLYLDILFQDTFNSSAQFTMYTSNLRLVTDLVIFSFKELLPNILFKYSENYLQVV